MSSAANVPPLRTHRNIQRLLPWRRATVRVVHGDTLASFADQAVRLSVARLTVISPWLSFTQGGALWRLVALTLEHGGHLTLVTRPPRDSSDEAAIDAVQRLPRARVICNDRLHAKVYVCETGRAGRGVAMVGSANITDGAQRLLEIGLLVRPYRGSRVLSDLANSAVQGVCSLTDTVALPRLSTRLSRRSNSAVA